MTRPGTLHQAVHGYRRGHELLATSTALSPADADAINHLSDLSGLPVTQNIPSYISCYPLPSGTYYVLARTWPDSDARRDGCVLTHSILIPNDTWSAGMSARHVARYLRKPNIDDIEQFSVPLFVQGQCKWVHKELFPCSEDFAFRYFIEGLAPLVWVDDAGIGDELILQLADVLWPAIRCRFAACSYTLQPRSLGQKNFDLMVAPAAAISRFSKIPQRHLIGYRREEAATASKEKYATALSRIIQFMEDGRLPFSETYESLKPFLPADPTALLRVLSIEDLRLRANDVPSASVAIMDVLAALLPMPDQALEEKERSIRFALRTANSAPPLAAMELYAAIASRCTRPAFKKLKHFRRDAVSTIASFVAKSPRDGLLLLARSRVRRGALAAAVGKGFRTADPESIRDLGDFGRQNPSALKVLLRFEPILARKFVEAHEGSEVPHALQEVHGWYCKSAAVARRGIAKELLACPHLALHLDLFRNVIGLAGKADVPVVLDIFLEVSMCADGVLPILLSFVSKFPTETDAYFKRSGIQTREHARLLAEVLPLSEEALETIDGLGAAAASWVLVDFLAREGGIAALDGVLAQESGRRVAQLVAHADMEDPNAVSAIRMFCERYDNDSLVDQWTPSVAAKLLGLGHPLADELGTALLEAASRRFVEGEIPQEAFCDWLALPIVKEQVRRQELSYLLRDLLQVDAGQVAASRVWAWLDVIGHELPVWSDRLLVNMIGSVFSATTRSWPTNATPIWCSLLARDGLECHSSAAQGLRLQALHLSLTHPELPLSPVVQATFPDVYGVTIASKLPTAADYLFFFVDWDRGKELRERLIEAYARSTWPRGDLLVTAWRAKIMEKLLSRMRRKGHQSMITQALNDLKRRKDLESQNVLSRLSSALRESRTEDWD